MCVLVADRFLCRQSAGRWARSFSPQGAIRDFLALICGECQQLLKPLHFQWLTRAGTRAAGANYCQRHAGTSPPARLLAAVSTAANALILNSLFTFSACNG
jgi:hypothetical protein